MDEALRERQHCAVAALVEAEQRALASEAPLREFSVADFPEASRFVASFEHSARRRPIFLILGATGLGKSELAGQVLQKVAGVLGLPGFVEVTVEDDGHLDFSSFDVSKHAGVLLDGIGDAMLLKRNREALQGRPKQLRGGRSQTMRFAYPYTLARRAVVATMDMAADNIHMLTSDHWLANASNVLLLRLRALVPLGVGVGALSREEQLRGWTVAEVVSFLKANDLEGPSETIFTNGVRGSDFLDMPVEVFTQDLRLSAFAARRIVAARSAFLRQAL